MARSLCKWRRDDVVRELGLISALVSEPKFVCQRCARAANDQSNLCHPTPLELEIKNDSPIKKLSQVDSKKNKKWHKKYEKAQKKLQKIEKKLQKLTK
jgi:hypothetical protein